MLRVARPDSRPSFTNENIRVARFIGEINSRVGGGVIGVTVTETLKNPGEIGVSLPRGYDFRG